MKSRVYIGKEIVTYVNNVEQSLDVTDDFMPESYSGSTAISKTVSVGSIPTSGAKIYSVNLVFSTTVEIDGSIPSW